MTTSAPRAAWQRDIRSRPCAPGDGPGRHEGAGAAWLRAAREALPVGGGHLDLGCGAGRMTFALADRWARGGWSIGADRDGEALARARARAAREGLAGASFVLLDVEREDYPAVLGGRTPDLVTAHLCMGPEILERAARVLPPGGAFAFVALHPALWKETGRPSRFALSEEEAEALLGRYGLAPSLLRVEIETLRFDTAREAIEGFFGGGRAVPRWRADGRWEAMRSYLEGGGRSITALAQVQCVCRKSPP